MGEGSKKYFFKKGKKHDFSIFEIWMLQKWIEIMDLILVFFFVGFPNNPNLDVSGHFGCKFFDGFPYPQKQCRYIDSPAVESQ